MLIRAAEELSAWLATAIAEYPDLVQEKVAVVGVVGTSDAGGGWKTWSVNAAFRKSVFLAASDPPHRDAEGPRITAFFEPASQAVLLCLDSYLDYRQCVGSLPSDGRALEWLSAAEAEWERALLLLAHLSTLLLIVEPVPRFDPRWCRVLRNLQALREEVGPAVSRALSGVEGVSSEWRRLGRPSAPRLLFAFGRAAVRPDLGYVKRSELVKRLEAALESQIFTLFRKSRVVQNNSVGAAIALPGAKEPFVLVFGPSEAPVEPVTMLLDLLHSLCPLAMNDGVGAPPLLTASTTPNAAPLMGEEEERGGGGRKEEGRRFSGFLHRHIDAAHADGFQDNVGKNVPPAHFELPRFGVWVRAAQELHRLLVLEPPSPDLAASLRRHCAPELEFSRSRCAKAFPVALRAYKDGLPDFYQSARHQGKLEQAMGILQSQGRGPALPEYEARLRAEAEAHWEGGRKGCEAVSLTGQPCVHPLHGPDKDHSSEARYLSTCSCGATQALRSDPFTLKEANLYFYQSAMFLCCQRKEAHDWPLRVPTPRAPDATAAAAAAVEPSEANFPALGTDLAQLALESTPGSRGATDPVGASDERMERDNRLIPASSSTNFLDAAASGEGKGSAEEEEEEDSSAAAEDGGDASTDDGTDLSGDDLANDGAGGRGDDEEAEDDKTADVTLTEPAAESKEEAAQESVWDEWMPHSGGPADALPSFPSWSLLCLGSASQYQPALGLRDQPNFSYGSGFLLPWDVHVRCDTERWNRALESMAASGWAKRAAAKPSKKPGSETSVRVWLGLEYECPRGHRFCLAAPDRILKQPKEASGPPKESGSWMAKSEAIPLWFPCACRSTPPLTAQLMRLHVVTPKAPVLVHLNPRVQPEPQKQGATFFPRSWAPSLALSPGRYYVLRFPYAYAGPKGPHRPPTEPALRGRLLKGLVSLTPVPL